MTEGLATVEAKPLLSPQEQRRNFRLGVLNGALFRIGDVFIDTEMVLTWFLAQLGASNLLIGLVSPLRFGGSFLLQMLVSGYIERRPYKLPFYRSVSVFRVATLLAFAALVALMPVDSPWLIVAFVVALALFSVGAGVVSIPFMDMVGKVVAPHRRGAFFGQRMFWGGLLALGGSSAVGFLLAEPEGLRFPRNVAVLFALAAVFYALTAWAWFLVKEPPSPVLAEPTRRFTAEVRTQFRRGFAVLRENQVYRRYAAVRLALTAAGWAAPFYVVYARQELGISAGVLGLYLGARTAAGIISNLVWARISDGQGNRRLIVVTNLLGLVTPVLVLAMGQLNRVAGPEVSTWLSYAFAAVFFTAGAYASGSGIGITNYLLDIAPDAQRPVYLAFTNTLFGLARFTGVASGLLVDWVGFNALLLLSAAFAAFALLLSFTMVEPRSDLGTGLSGGHAL
ncbi:MAG: MFS transporter [Anaerolineae bacterium]